MVDIRGTFEPFAYRRLETYEHRRFTIEQGELATPTGAAPYTICHMRPFVCVLAVLGARTPEARLLLVRQWRYAVGAWQLEAPAGGIEEGEEPEAAALRELREESGLVVDELVPLGLTYPSAGSTDERAWLFCARCTDEKAQNLDAGEQIECVTVTRREMEDLLMSPESEYGHAVSAVAWMRMQGRGLVDEWMPLS